MKKIILLLLASILCLSLFSQSKYILVIHGGAGVIEKKNMTDEREAAYIAKLREALDAGEAILKGAADRILKQVRQSDTVARIGDEQFAVILPKVATPQNAVTVAQKLINALLPELQAAGGEATGVPAGPSIGIAIFPTFAADQEALVRAADAAMYKAKERGQGFSFGTA